jgi:hypothetical protein
MSRTSAQTMPFEAMSIFERGLAAFNPLGAVTVDVVEPPDDLGTVVFGIEDDLLVETLDVRALMEPALPIGDVGIVENVDVLELDDRDMVAALTVAETAVALGCDRVDVVDVAVLLEVLCPVLVFMAVEVADAPPDVTLAAAVDVLGWTGAVARTADDVGAAVVDLVRPTVEPIKVDLGIVVTVDVLPRDDVVAAFSDVVAALTVVETAVVGCDRIDVVDVAVLLEVLCPVVVIVEVADAPPDVILAAAVDVLGWTGAVLVVVRTVTADDVGAAVVEVRPTVEPIKVDLGIVVTVDVLPRDDVVAAFSDVVAALTVVETAVVGCDRIDVVDVTVLLEP